MKRCKKCGSSMALGKYCYRCMLAWQDKRIAAYKDAVLEMGEPTKDNLSEIKRYVKETEKQP